MFRRHSFKSSFAVVALFMSFSPAAMADTSAYCASGGSVSSYCHAFSAAPAAPVTPPESTVSASAERLKNELNSVGVETFTAANYRPGVIRHLVLFRYRAEVTTEQKAETKRRFLALAQLAQRNGHRYIVSIETGGEISGEGADQALEQGFIVTFKSQGDRNYYVGQPVVTDSAYYEPAHQAFKDFVGPLLDDNGALVFDFAVGG